MVVHGKSTFGNNMSSAVTLRDFQVVEAGGDSKFTVNSASGVSLIEGSLSVHGSADVHHGYITSPEFIAKAVVSDRINERTRSTGVLVEGALVRDGGVELTRISQICRMMV